MLNLLSQVAHLYYLKDTEGLTKLYHQEITRYQQSGKKPHHYQAIMIQSFLCCLKKETMKPHDINVLTDFLFSIDHWGKFELIILGNSMHSIHIETLNLLVNELTLKNQLFEDEETNYLLTVQLLLNASYKALFDNHPEYANRYLRRLEIMNIKNTKLLYEMIIYRFLTAVTSSILEKTEEQTQRIQRILQGLSLLELDESKDQLSKDLLHFKKIYHI